jgi:rubrerythrin
MSDRVLNLASAIQLAKSAEQNAASLYASAAKEAVNPLVRRLFEQLAEFEDHHYQKLVELERSLQEKGAFIEYEGLDEAPIAPTSEVKRLRGVKKTSAMKVLKQAMEVEVKAEQRYTELSDQTSDPQGRRMFTQLAQEEHHHYTVLKSAYYDVGNLKPLV